MTFYYVLYFTMYFGPVAFTYKINNLSWVELLTQSDIPIRESVFIFI